MTTSEFFGKFKSKYLWGNLAAMALTIVALAFAAKIGIDIYTHHGESIPVPNLVHKSFDDAQQTLDGLGLDMVVSDTGYVKTLPAGCILDQSVTPGERVKSGHIIYVTINSASSPTISLPDVIDNCSLREAMAKLSAMGFKLGQPKYVPGEPDWVYGIMVNGHEVVAGDKVPTDATLTIVVGNGKLADNDSVEYIDPETESDGIDMESGGDDDFVEVPSTEEEKPAEKSEESRKETAPAEKNNKPAQKE